MVNQPVKHARFKVPWYQGDTIPVGIGQGYWTATPMQIAKAASVIAESGVEHRPHLLKGIVEENDKVDVRLNKIGRLLKRGCIW